MQATASPLLDTIQAQSKGVRKMAAGLVEPLKAQADTIPAGWNNNIRWHIGHLVITPRLVTCALNKEPLGVPEEYRAWFSKGTGPRDWKDASAVPSIDQLLEEMVRTPDDIAAIFRGREEQPFAQPYTTSVGIVLAKPADSIAFSMMHDGIHLGMLLALRRALK